MTFLRLALQMQLLPTGHRDIYPTEYLNTIEVANLPHNNESHVEVRAAVILLRTLNPSDGLCNGTRMRT